MRWAIVGAGAMGSVYGGHLALAGNAVTLVDVREDHVAAIRERGLVMHRPAEGPVTVRLPATTDPARELGDVDAALFLCKGFDTVAAARSVVGVVGPDAWAVTVQNGLGNDRALAEVFPADRVVPGTTTVGAMTDGPGEVTMSPGTAHGESLTHLRPPRTSAGIPPRLDDVAACLSDAGLPAKIDESADVVIWTKLAMAGSMGPLTAILGRTVQAAWEDSTGRRLMEDLFDEILAVAAADGVALDREALWRHCAGTYESVGHHATSMAADVAAGRPTEIETMALAVAELGARHGVDTPVIRTIGRLVATVQATYAHPV